MRCWRVLRCRWCVQQATLNVAPTPAEGEEMFAVAHIFASFNDTFVVCGPCFVLVFPSRRVAYVWACSCLGVRVPSHQQRAARD